MEFVGSFYRYSGEQLTSSEIIFVRDHHYNEEDQCFHLKKLLENSVCDPHTHTVIFDHVLRHDDVLKDYQLISFPSFLAKENRQFIQQQIQPDWSNKTVTFNFMINKPRPHRTLLLKLVEEFELTDYCHALPWKVNTINNIPVTDYRFGPEVVLDQGIRNGNFRNARTYQGLLQKTVFEPTCISLITEPAFYEKETIITEKTLMAMYAGTIPIWVGGWGIPDYLKTAGFDTFDDIVDHSYQWLEDPTDRCRQAIKLNQDLLRYFDLTKHIHWQCRSRLKKNVELLESNFFLTACQEKINQYTGKIQEILIKMLSDQVDKV
jgi:hypothetical protein